MGKSRILLLIIALFSIVACKSEYEKIRTSGDMELILTRANRYYEKEDWQKAKTLYELVMPSLRGRPDAEGVYFKYANCHYQAEEYLLSAYYMKNFANTYTTSPQREEAAYLGAYSHYLISPNFRLTQDESQTAIDELQLFTNLYPESSRVPDCNKLIDELRRKLEQKAYAEGKLYFDLRQYQSAMASFDNLLRDYPESPDVERVRYYAARSAFELAENSVIAKRADRYTEAIKRCRLFIEKFENSSFTDEILEIKKTSEKALSKYRGT